MCLGLIAGMTLQDAKTGSVEATWWMWCLFGVGYALLTIGIIWGIYLKWRAK